MVARMACETVGVDRRARLRDARLYFVADRGGLARALDGALAGGVDLFQLRDKDATDDELLAAAGEARERCHAAGALFVLNDRPDLAAACGADGVHVGQDDMPVARAAQARRRRRDRRALDALDAAGPGRRAQRRRLHRRRAGARDADEGRAARRSASSLVRYAASHVDVPWFAIGGIDPTTVDAVVEAGARRIVVVRAIADADDPEAAARALRAAVNGGRRGPA